MTERGLKNINVFYSTFTNVFFIFVTFFTLFNVFYIFFWNVFYIYAEKYRGIEKELVPTGPVSAPFVRILA